MSNQSKPFTLFDLYAFLGQQLGNQPELGNLLVADMEMPMVLASGTETFKLAQDSGIMLWVSNFYSALDSKVAEGAAYIEETVRIMEVSTREEIAAKGEAFKKGIH